MKKISNLTCRSIRYLNDLTIVSEENILVVDSGCDQSIVSNVILVSVVGQAYFFM